MDQFAARIEALFPESSVYSTAELTAAMDQRLVYFRQLSTMLNAGVGMVQSLDTLVNRVGPGKRGAPTVSVRGARNRTVVARPDSPGLVQIFSAKSGCSKAIPVSMTATMTGFSERVSGRLHFT